MMWPLHKKKTGFSYQTNSGIFSFTEFEVVSFQRLLRSFYFLDILIKKCDLFIYF